MSTQIPYNFGRSLAFPFMSGPGSAGFVIKSAILYSLVSTVLMALFGKMLIGPVVEFIQLAEQIDAANGEPPTEEVFKLFSLMGRMVWPFLLVSLLSWFVLAIIEGAFYRRVFREEFKSMPWRFGRDEVLVMLSQLVYFLIFFGVILLFYIFLAIVIGLGAVIGGGGGALAGIFLFLGIIALIVGSIWIGIRLSPITPLSVVRGRLALGEAWRVTKGRFWLVFASFVVVFVIAYIVSLIVQLILQKAVLGAIMPSMDALQNMSDSDPGEAINKVISILMQPGNLTAMALAFFLYMVVQGVLRLVYAGIVANATDIYLREQGEKDVSVFD